MDGYNDYYFRLMMLSTDQLITFIGLNSVWVLLLAKEFLVLFIGGRNFSSVVGR